MINPHKFLIEKLKSKNYSTYENTYDENFYTDNIFNLLEDESINNVKGGFNDLFEIEEFKVGNRSKTELISDKELIKIINK
jgi:hypothetical protein